MNANQDMRFSLGQIVATAGALEALQRNNSTGLEYLRRHTCGDWGVLCEEDKEINEEALRTGARPMSVYFLPDETKLWIITDAVVHSKGTRQATTLLLPDEY